MTYFTIQNKLAGNVIDITQNSTVPGADLDAYTPKTSENANQLWEFIPDPAGSGYYFIKCALAGHVIDIQQNSTQPGALLDAYTQKTSQNDNQLWAFNPDPAGSGYYFIKSKLSGNVIDIQQNSTKPGALLDASPQKVSDYDNQLWKVVDGAFPAPVWSSISWGPLGTGAPNVSTTSSGGTECAYQVSATINQNGSCTFSGYYQNRGDVWWGTAPPQAFVAAFMVYDTAGRVYTFSYQGDIPSAPQNGSLVTWNLTQTCPLIAQNWYPIAAANWGQAWYENSWSESPLSVFGGWLPTLADDLGKVASFVVSAFAGGNGGGGDSGGDISEVVQVPKVIPSLPPQVPTGVAATAHQAGASIAGIGK